MTKNEYLDALDRACADYKTKLFERLKERYPWTWVFYSRKNTKVLIAGFRSGFLAGDLFHSQYLKEMNDEG